MTVLYIVAAFGAGTAFGRYLASCVGRERDALRRDRDRWKRAALLNSRFRRDPVRDRFLRVVP